MKTVVKKREERGEMGIEGGGGESVPGVEISQG